MRLEMIKGFEPTTWLRDGAISALKVGPDAWRIHGDMKPSAGSPLLPDGGALNGVRSTGETAITITSSDAGALIETTAAGSVTVVVPLDDAIAVVRFVQVGAGVVSFNAGAGVRLEHCVSKQAQS